MGFVEFFKSLFKPSSEKLFEIIQADYLTHKTDSIFEFFPEELKQDYQDSLRESMEAFSEGTNNSNLFMVDEITSIHTVAWLLEKDYLKALLRKRRTLVVVDDYGDTSSEAWISELKKFCMKRSGYFEFDIEVSLGEDLIELFQDIDTDSLCNINLLIHPDEDPFDQPFEIMSEIINEALPIDEYFQNKSGVYDIDTISDPYEYEEAIAEILNHIGYEAHATSGSGDQGADVIAKLGGITHVIQAKLYSQPVGNKAVQEVAAAKGYYDADYAYVVTNNSYTKSAKELANSLEVVLLHHDQIQDCFSGGNVINEDATTSGTLLITECLKELKERIQHIYWDDDRPPAILYSFDKFFKYEDLASACIAINSIVDIYTIFWLHENDYFDDLLAKYEQLLLDHEDELPDSWFEGLEFLASQVKEQFKYDMCTSLGEEMIILISAIDADSILMISKLFDLDVNKNQERDDNPIVGLIQSALRC